ncbi:AfsR/SARP family transcriptional regulator [Nocardioides mesophilus]|uniref:AAA family ATPase n=1 Tax=Nocardioides mesophilus TaxID=433659 RepID=A0A7G9RBH5_9ACTN|nr:AfsR/SARP family transcriptional regulator [Nocardioides mesophilus]QNN52950.1 AAA family ATPase [Nocardioides mesophilus]
MRVSVLGAVEARSDSGPVDLGTPKQRALLTALALSRGRPVPADSLADLLWDGAPPAQAATTLQGYVAGLRRALEPDRPARAPATILVTRGAGYALEVTAEDLDASRFDAAVATAHQRLAARSDPLDQAGLEALLDELDATLALWRGRPYADLEEAAAAVAERARLEELRLVALEDRAVAGLALGRHATVAAELESLTTHHPLRERLWALRALALTRSGRQADALEVLRRVRTLLADELGLEPGAELRDLQAAVLRQDPALDWTPPPAAPRLVSAQSPAADTATPTPDRQTPATQTPAAGTAAGSGPRASQPGPPPLPTWPMVGRRAELDALVGLLDRAEGGVPAFAAVVGEPGIGKSRLLAELSARASARGATVLLGRCSQDDGAPPLWPWAGVLRGLDRPLPTAEHDDESSRFRTWDDIVAALRSEAADQTLLVLLDDLHWADVSSLRVLGLLLESLDAGRLLVVTTWRDRPAPSGALGAVAEQLSRRHALRLQLHGLGAEDVTRVVEAVAEQRPSPDQADALRHRTDGNPFFLVEYARLAGRDGDLAALLDEPDPPHAVTDVVARRLDRLPGPTRAALAVASVVGRAFDLATLVAATGTGEDELLDALDDAVGAGLVREDGVGAFRFAHALVRDTVEATTSPTRRARWHARVAEALEGVPGREGEVARHWHAAGPGHVARAWRAGLRAGKAALRVHAYDEATALLLPALEALGADPQATPAEEYGVLVELAAAHRGNGNWIDLRPVVHRALAAADRAGDEAAYARAALLTSSDALWQAAHHGKVDPVLVAALRRSLDRLPTGDDELRCRAMLALAGELYYGVAAAEREALAGEAVAMARRIGDPALLMSACCNAFVSTWRPATTDSRAALAREALDIAVRLGDAHALTFVRTVCAVSAAELGDTKALATMASLAREGAEQQRNVYALVVLDSLEIPWLVMRGEQQRAEELLAHMVTIGQKMGLAQQDDAVSGAVFSLLLWRGEHEQVVARLAEVVEEQVLPVAAALLAMLTRAGRLEEARALLSAGELDLGPDTWFALLPWSFAAEVALALDEPRLAATAYRLLAPHAGRMACAGSGVALGPVDAYLALAARALGETALATRHADAAVERCRAWRIPLAESWFTGQRERWDF